MADKTGNCISCEFLVCTLFLILQLLTQTKSDDERLVSVKEGEHGYIECSINVDQIDDGNSIVWLKDGKDLTGQARFVHLNNGTLMITNVHHRDTGNYSCRYGSDSEFQIESQRIRVVVEEKKEVSIPSIVNNVIQLGTVSKIRCITKGYTEQYTVKWMKIGHDSLDSHVTVRNTTLFFDGGVRRQDAGEYVCIVTDSTGKMNASIKLDVVEFPHFRVSPKSQQVAQGSTLILHCEGMGDPKPVVKWDKDKFHLSMDSDHISELSNNTLIIENFDQDDAGTYGCTAGNKAGFNRSEAVVTFLSAGYSDNMTRNDGTVINNDLDTRIIKDMEDKITKTINLTLGGAALYLVIVAILVIWYRYRRAKKKAANLAPAPPMTPNSVKDGTSSIELRERRKQQKVLLSNGHNGDVPAGSRDDLDKQSQASSCRSSATVSKRTGISVEKNFSRKDLQTIMLLGHGEFGDVYLAKTQALPAVGMVETIVMVKELHSTKESIRSEFRREMDMFFKLDHEKVAKLLAVCRECEPFLLIMEYSDRGDLKQFLLATRKDTTVRRPGPRPEPLTCDQIIAICKQIAIGMDYLTNQGFVHRDLATRNCLVSSYFSVKISSVSLSKDTYAADYFAIDEQDVPIRWAPKDAVFDSQWTPASDVWSYGVLVWEILTQAQQPYSELADEAVLTMLKASELNLSIPDKFPEVLRSVISSCLVIESAERPSFSEIIRKLDVNIA